MSKKAYKAARKKVKVKKKKPNKKDLVQIELTPVGINLLSIIAEKNKNITSKSYTINYSYNFTSFNQSRDPKLGLFNFSYKVSYDPDFGFINLKGELLLQFKTEKDLQEFSRLWNLKKLPVFPIIPNFVHESCLLQCTSLAKDMKLPAPFKIEPFPTKKELKSVKEVDTTKTGMYV